VKRAKYTGMAMRGGIVTSHFVSARRFTHPSSKKEKLISFLPSNQLEGLRWINHLRPNGKILMNDHKVNPSRRQFRRNGISKGIPEKIKSRFKGFYLVKGTEMALELGMHVLPMWCS